MEKKRCADWGLVAELTRGKELAQQLATDPCVSPDLLLAQILSCYQKAISFLASGDSPATSAVTPAGGCCSPDGAGGVSGQVHKKRKTMSKRTHRVSEVYSAAGKHDGFSWRKYGQKDILGALHPRAYYRCTHRDSQGCLATKQVQKSDHDPTVEEVSHNGRHTCVQTISSATNGPDQKQVDQTVAVIFGAELKVDTQRQNDTVEDDILSSFLFPCDPVGLDGIFAVDEALMGGYSPEFLSPATSGGSSYFSDVTVSVGTSAANSPVGVFDFPFDDLESFSFNFQSPPL